MRLMSDPLPPGHGEPARPPSLTDGEYVPVCPTCAGAVRRDLRGDPLDWRCDLHGRVVPTWEVTRDE